MSHLGARLALTGLIMLGILGNNVGKEVARTLSLNQSIGDFTPFIRVRRYIKPTAEPIQKINKLEQLLIDHIAKYGDEKAVDEALNKATEVTKNLINQLNKVNLFWLSWFSGDQRSERCHKASKMPAQAA